MAYKSCPDCGERVYKLGCVNCNEAAYIEQQRQHTARYYGEKDGPHPLDAGEATWGGYPLTWRGVQTVRG